MKTKEFIKGVNELGYQLVTVRDKNDNLDETAIFKDDEQIVVIWEKVTYAISTIIDDLFMPTLENNNLEELYELCFEYAQTPVEDRKEEKKFYLEHRWLNLDTDNYLHLDVDDGSCMLDDNEEFSYTKIKLTKKEIKEIKKKFNTDLADFELVEVEE